jgi:hypothetical protein
MDEDLTLLVSELSSMVASVPMTNGGRMHRHVGMIVEVVEYITFSHMGNQFLVPTNAVPYPTEVDQDVVVRAQQIAEHKQQAIEFKT